MKKFEYVADNERGEPKTEGHCKHFWPPDYCYLWTPNGMGGVERPPEPKYTKTETPDMVTVFEILGELAREKAIRHKALESKGILADTYNSYRNSVERAHKSTKKYLGRTLPDIPALPGNDYGAGLSNLADHCNDCIAALTGKEQYKPPNLVALNLVPAYFQIDVRTLYRWITKGKLTDYPKGDGVKQVDVNEVAKHRKRRVK